MERGTISGIQNAARWPDFLPVPHSASLFRASSLAGPRHASTAGLPQKLIVLAACNSKFGTQRVSIRIIVEQDAKTRAPHLHNSNLLEQNLQQLHNSTWLRFTPHFSPASAGSCCVAYKPLPKCARSSTSDAKSCAAVCSKFPTLWKASSSV